MIHHLLIINGKNGNSSFFNRNPDLSENRPPPNTHTRTLVNNVCFLINYNCVIIKSIDLQAGFEFVYNGLDVYKE